MIQIGPVIFKIVNVVLPSHDRAETTARCREQRCKFQISNSKLITEIIKQKVKSSL